jgi:hypothetical protein
MIVSKHIVQDLQNAGIVKPYDIRAIWTSQVLDLFENFYDSPTACTILSYFVRAEVTEYPSEFVSVGNDTMDKELKASQQKNLPQALNYAPLFTEYSGRIHEEVNVTPSSTIYLWKRHMDRFSQHFTDPKTVILPHYNRRKNVGYKTQSLYYEACGTHRDERNSVTSFDLLKLYAETGIQIGGPLEIRIAWRFNDLKPRSYYCLGGDAFWPALFIKDITKYLMAAFPSTDPFTRFDVLRIRRLIGDEILVTYDYTSFTTSLAELKYFLWYLTVFLEGTLVHILDVNLGIQEIDLGDLLSDYNETVNHHQVFDTSRIFRDNEDDVLFQNRNGSLGVGGNIGLSGLNHGISLAGFNDTPATDSVVGDDALLKITRELLFVLIAVVNKLGIIHPEKVTTIPVPAEDKPLQKEEHAFKYLKRPLRVNFLGEIETGCLDFFPNIASCLFPEGDGIHDSPGKDISVLVRSYISQVGKYLTNLARGHFMNDPDAELMLVVLRSVYLKYNLPLEGHIPSTRVFTSWVQLKAGKEQVNVSGLLWIPPLDTLEVFITPWMSILFDRFAGQDVVVHHMVDGDIPPPINIHPGMEFHATGGGRFLTLLQDLGYIERTAVMITRSFGGEVLRQAEDMFMQYGSSEMTNLHALYHILVLQVPFYYVDYVLRVFGDPHNPEDVWDRNMELQSLGITTAVS